MARRPQQREDKRDDLSRPKRREKDDNQNRSISRGVGSVLLLMLGAIITLSFFGKAGTVGVLLNDWLLSSIFGVIRYITPIMCAILAWALVQDISPNYRATHWLGTGLFLLSVAGAFHMMFPVESMWQEAVEGAGGGILGMIAWPLKSYLGSIAAWIILVGLACISIILVFHSALTRLVLLHKTMLTGIGWVGKGILALVSTLFMRTDRSLGLDEEEEDDEKNETPTPSFRERMIDPSLEENSDEELEQSKKNMHRTEELDEDDEGGIGEMDVGQKEDTADTGNPSWMQNVIIKPLPSLSLLKNKKERPTSGDIKANQHIIQEMLKEFHVDVDMGEVRVGPTVTQYTLKPSKGVKLSRITALNNDLALALAAHPIRIEAPIPGKSLVGIEVPNERTATVSLHELLEGKEFLEREHNMMIALGKDVAGKIWFADLPRMPHLLVAGATGSGKTVCVNTIIMSLLFQNTADNLRFLMVDPKRVELTLYDGIPHLLAPVITNTPETINALKWTISEMERRFELLSKAGCRNLASYNAKYRDDRLPCIVFIIDELADLMATAASEVEAGIIRLAQMARAVGIHLILATQRPSVDVITGLMKANIPARIAFSVASLVDSRTILDTSGAEKLLGRGDMLFQTAELSKPVRIQGAFISENELKQVVSYLKSGEKPTYDESILSKSSQNKGTGNLFGGPSDDRDPLFDDSRDAVVRAGKASASLLQRRLKIGYARAARILDELEEAGIIGPGEGAKPREILMTKAGLSGTMNAGGELTVFNDPEENADPEEMEALSEDDEQEKNDQRSETCPETGGIRDY